MFHSSSFEALKKNSATSSFLRIGAHYKNQWVLLKETLLSGNIESSETFAEATRRILLGDLGCKQFHLVAVENYQIQLEDKSTEQGTLCYAEIDDFESSENIVLTGDPYALLNPLQSFFQKRIELKTELLSKLKPYEHIIWDFNGTLVDDLELAVKAIEVILQENNLPIISEAQYREQFGFPIKGYYERLGFDFDKHSFQALSDRFHEEYHRHRLDLWKLFPEIHWHLEFFSKKRKQSILSAASQWNLEDWVKHFEIGEYFHHIFGLSDNFATSKLERGRELIEISGVDPKSTILIGDTDHDYEVAKTLGIEVLLISDGHQSYERLAKVHHNVLKTRFYEP